MPLICTPTPICASVTMELARRTKSAGSAKAAGLIKSISPLKSIRLFGSNSTHGTLAATIRLAIDNTAISISANPRGKESGTSSISTMALKWLSLIRSKRAKQLASRSASTGRTLTTLPTGPSSPSVTRALSRSPTQKAYPTVPCPA